MTVSIGSSLPLHLQDLPQDEAGPRIELVDGGLLVTPLAGPGHQHVVGELYSALRAAAPAGWTALPGAKVVRRAAQDRLMIPDVLVVESAVLSEDSPYVDPSDVLLVVEVESPSTKSTDRLLKRDLYAQWRIPSYWIVDAEARTVTRLRLGGERLHEVGDPEGSWLSSVDVSAVWPR